MSAGTKHSDQHDEGAAERPTREAEPLSATVPKTAPRAVPLGERGEIYTMTAREGLDAAELVNAAFGRKTIGAVTPRHVEVVAPDGPSTAGGKRARQTIRLVPASGEGAPVMCGFLDVARKVVELRSYRSVAQQYHERFGASFDVTDDEYTALCKELEATLGPFRYAFTNDSEAPVAVHTARGKVTTGPANAASAPVLNIVLLTLAVAIVAGVTLAMIVR